MGCEWEDRVGCGGAGCVVVMLGLGRKRKGVSGGARGCRRCRQVQAGAGRCREVQGRDREVQAGAGRCRQVQAGAG